ncbi:VOC family protein [Haladaptatus sp. DYF46]|uniref:bleomycin resistance protein n=1 Tax=Haladaptatus sp. DYF46 TaxID=2886041 RepID=UPI001E47914A|nr:VOC family protein [Haladaptatus sp. DYF46]
MEWSSLTPELLVTDYQKSFSFYVETLGFTAEFTRDDPLFAYLSLEGAQLMIEERTGSEWWVTSEINHPYGSGINFQITVDPIDPYASRLKNDECQLFEGIHEEWYQVDEGERGNRQFLIQDPDGYLLRFMEHIGTR